MKRFCLTNMHRRLLLFDEQELEQKYFANNLFLIPKK